MRGTGPEGYPNRCLHPRGMALIINYEVLLFFCCVFFSCVRRFFGTMSTRRDGLARNLPVVLSVPNFTEFPSWVTSSTSCIANIAVTNASLLLLLLLFLLYY